MRSLFLRVVLWFGAMLLFSLAAFSITSWYIGRGKDPVFRLINGILVMQLDDASAAYTAGGAQALARELQRMDRYFPGRRYLLDSAGHDLVTGEDRSAFIVPRPGPPPLPFLRGKPHPIDRPSADGRFHFIIVPDDPNFTEPNLLPYFTWIVGVLLLLSWALAFTLVRPLRQLRDSMLGFAHGDLKARIHPRRKDEIGDVARSFDHMADRIETLLNADRRLLQDVSHELRSPLARMNFAIELARNNPDRDKALDPIKKEADRLSELVGELIEMNRAEGDPTARVRTAVELPQLVRTVVENCSIEADARNVALVANLDSLPVLEGDEELLRRAVENVLRNAIRHSPPDEKITVTLKADVDEAVLTIRDRGPGVPEEHLREIFRPFFRVEDHRARQSGGMGLGLSIAQRAVQLHHGQITARNSSPGLEVSLRLPLNFHIT